jgi:hypothetical protein
MTIGTTAGTPCFGPPMFAVCKGDQAIYTFSSADDHISTVAAIATAGSAQGNMFFAAKGDDPVPPFACFDFNFSAINKHDDLGPYHKTKEFHPLR